MNTQTIIYIQAEKPAGFNMEQNNFVLAVQVDEIFQHSG